MFLSPHAVTPATLPQMSTLRLLENPPPNPQLSVYEPILFEDGCTVPRPPLRLNDPGLWCAAGILAAATAWLIA